MKSLQFGERTQEGIETCEWDLTDRVREGSRLWKRMKYEALNSFYSIEVF